MFGFGDLQPLWGDSRGNRHFFISSNQQPPGHPPALPPDHAKILHGLLPLDSDTITEPREGCQIVTAYGSTQERDVWSQAGCLNIETSRCDPPAVRNDFDRIITVAEQTIIPLQDEGVVVIAAYRNRVIAGS